MEKNTLYPALKVQYSFENRCWEIEETVISSEELKSLKDTVESVYEYRNNNVVRILKPKNQQLETAERDARRQAFQHLDGSVPILVGAEVDPTRITFTYFIKEKNEKSSSD